MDSYMKKIVVGQSGDALTFRLGVDFVRVL
jgi:hypothetical protein